MACCWYGLVSFVLLLGAMAWEGWTRRRRGLGVEDAILLGALAGILVQNQLEHILGYPVLFSNSLSLILLGWWRAGPAARPPGDGADSP